MHNLKRMSGFSLIEALIAFLIIGVGLLGAAKMQALLSTDSAVSQQRDEAVVVAQDLIERFRGFTALPTTSGRVAYDDIASSATAETVSGINASYNRSWTVEECCIDQTTQTNACPAANCGSNEMRWKNLSVAVSWTDKGNTANNINLTTKISRLAPAQDAALLVASAGTGGTGTSQPGTTDPIGGDGDSDEEPPLGNEDDLPPAEEPPTEVVSPTQLSCSQQSAESVHKSYEFTSCSLSATTQTCGCTLSSSGNPNNIHSCWASATIANGSAPPTVTYVFSHNKQTQESTVTLSCH
ncbi:hypothetical protein D3C78_701550 [compost metagenome]